MMFRCSFLAPPLPARTQSVMDGSDLLRCLERTLLGQWFERCRSKSLDLQVWLCSVR